MYVLHMLRRRTSQERVVNKLKPIIAEVFQLARAREAFEYGAGTHSPGHQRFTVARLLLAEDTPERVKCE